MSTFTVGSLVFIFAGLTVLALMFVFAAGRRTSAIRSAQIGRPRSADLRIHLQMLRGSNVPVREQTLHLF